MYFLAKIKFYNEDTKEESFEELLLSAEDYVGATSILESWYDTDLLSIEHLEAITNQFFLRISSEIGEAIKSNPENLKFFF